MNSLYRFLIRASSFLRKEFFEVLRQPRLILTLVLGPFFILLLFGVGFNNKNPTFRTVFVAAQDSQIRDQIKKYATSLGPQLVFAGVVTSEAAARESLQRGEVDVIVITPEHVSETVRQGERPVFEIYHNEIDPLNDNYIRFVGRIYINEVNRRLLQTIVEEGQKQATQGEQDLETVLGILQDLQKALESNDQATAQQNLQDLDRIISSWSLAVEATLQLYSALEETTGTTAAEQTQAALAEARRSVNDLEKIREGLTTITAEEVSQVETELVAVESRLHEFTALDAGTLVNLFGAETRQIAGIHLSYSAYYTPAVIALLLQHLCITFGALAIVREEWTGTSELFRVAPISALEILLGKFASYMVFSGLLAVALTALVVFVLGVPMLGSWLAYVSTIIVLIAASIGVGFIVSMLAKEVNQAIQYTMILLLASVFFTGFFLDLERFRAPIRMISRVLPATYGIRLLQSVMLRGKLSPVPWLFTLTGIGLGLFLVAWLLLRHRMRAE
jgi:ABC-2 type transport system permease protein